MATAKASTKAPAADPKRLKTIRRYQRRKSLYDFAMACEALIFEPARKGKLSVGDIVELPNPAIRETLGIDHKDFFVVTMLPRVSESGHLEHYGLGMAVRNAHGEDYDRDASKKLANRLGKLLAEIASPEGFSSSILPAWGKDYSGEPVHRVDTATHAAFLPLDRDDEGELVGPPRAPKAVTEETASKGAGAEPEAKTPKASRPARKKAPKKASKKASKKKAKKGRGKGPSAAASAASRAKAESHGKKS